MPYRPRFVPLAVLCAAGCGALCGCAQQSKEKELAGVAKDWAMTIRASQVIPIYPLREDLEPGDVFLVTTPLQDQATQYRESGFLPLDQQLARLHPVDKDHFYNWFYHNSFGIGADSAPGVRKDFPPNNWRFPAGTDPWIELPSGTRAKGSTAWTRAPRVYFPTYTFKVASGVGVALAFPIQAVPVGLSAMGTDSATGSAQLKDAFTYGLSLEEISPLVERWAAQNRELLAAQYTRCVPNPIYVRVVNRVYAVGGLKVSLTNDKAFAMDVKAGVNAPTAPTPVQAEEDFKKRIETMSAATRAVQSTQAGGNVKITFASSRSVDADETFDRPLVVGFISFDYLVKSGGYLETPSATRVRLNNQLSSEGTLFSPEQEEISVYSRAVGGLGDTSQRALLGSAAAKLGESFQPAYTQALAAGAKPWDAFQTAIMITKPDNARVVIALRHAWQETQLGS